MSKKAAFYAKLEFALFFVIVLPMAWPRQVADPAQAQRSALARLTVSAVGMLGMLVVRKLRRGVELRERSAEPVFERDETAPEPEAAGGQFIEVVSESTPESFWRCNLYVLLNKWKALSLLYIASLLPTLLILQQVARIGRAWVPIALPLCFVVGFALMLGCTCLALAAQFRKRFPTAGSVRICKTRLTREGFRDVMPDRVNFFGWESITDAREHNGDVYVWAGNRGSYIPRNTFPDRGAAQRFYQAIVTLWKSRGAEWPGDDEPGPDLTSAPAPGGPIRPTAEDNPYAPPRATITRGASALGSNLVALTRSLLLAGLIGGLLSVVYGAMR